MPLIDSVREASVRQKIIRVYWWRQWMVFVPCQLLSCWAWASVPAVRCRYRYAAYSTRAAGRALQTREFWLWRW